MVYWIALIYHGCFTRGVKATKIEGYIEAKGGNWTLLLRGSNSHPRGCIRPCFFLYIQIHYYYHVKICLSKNGVGSKHKGFVFGTNFSTNGKSEFSIYQAFDLL
jgi:hypothetical protein